MNATVTQTAVNAAADEHDPCVLYLDRTGKWAVALATVADGGNVTYLADYTDALVVIPQVTVRSYREALGVRDAAKTLTFTVREALDSGEHGPLYIS